MLVRLYGCGTRRHNLTANSLILWLLQSLHVHFHNVPRALGAGVFCTGIHSTALHFDWLWFSEIVFALHLLHMEMPLMRGEHYTYLWR